MLSNDTTPLSVLPASKSCNTINDLLHILGFEDSSTVECDAYFFFKRIMSASTQPDWLKEPVEEWQLDHYLKQLVRQMHLF